MPTTLVSVCQIFQNRKWISRLVCGGIFAMKSNTRTRLLTLLVVGLAPLMSLGGCGLDGDRWEDWYYPYGGAVEEFFFDFGFFNDGWGGWYDDYCCDDGYWYGW